MSSVEKEIRGINLRPKLGTYEGYKRVEKAARLPEDLSLDNFYRDLI